MRMELFSYFSCILVNVAKVNHFLVNINFYMRLVFGSINSVAEFVFENNKIT